MNDVEKFLQKNNIAYIRYEHPAVFTCEEAEKHCVHIPGIASKNLFLQDEKKKRFFLVIAPDYKRADLKSLALELGTKKLSFSSPETLKRILCLTPGSVSPFGLLNDADHKVELFIDRDVWASETVQFHPNINTATLQLDKADFAHFLEKVGFSPRIIVI